MLLRMLKALLKLDGRQRACLLQNPLTGAKKSASRHISHASWSTDEGGEHGHSLAILVGLHLLLR